MLRRTLKRTLAKTRHPQEFWPGQNSSPVSLCPLKIDPQGLLSDAKDLEPPRAKLAISIPANEPESKAR